MSTYTTCRARNVFVSYLFKVFLSLAADYMTSGNKVFNSIISICPPGSDL